MCSLSANVDLAYYLLGKKRKVECNTSEHITEITDAFSLRNIYGNCDPREKCKASETTKERVGCDCRGM